MKLFRRKTDMTAEQRHALNEARRILHPHFAGESVRLDLPKLFSDDRAKRQERIAEALRQGEAPRVISRREDVSVRLVQIIRRDVVGYIGGRRRNFPP